jgi:hypothetical protein
LKSGSTDPWAASCALFFAASFFNHSDIANCSYNIRGAVMIVRARKAIKKDEELSISYSRLPYAHVESKAERENIILQHFNNGICPCNHCEDDRLDGLDNLVKRRNLFEKQWSVLLKENDAIGLNSPLHDWETLKVKTLAFVSNLEKTYRPSHGPFKPDLIIPYYILADLHHPSDPSQHLRANPFGLKALLAAGAEFDFSTDGRIKVLAGTLTRENGVAIMLDMVWRLAKTGKRETTKEAAHWIEAAMQMARIYYEGDSPRRFLERYEAKLKEGNLERLARAVGTSRSSCFPCCGRY